MNTKLLLTLAGSALAVVALAGCSSTTGTPTTAASASPSMSASKDPTASPDAATASGKLGQIIVDGKGMTAYVWDGTDAIKETAGRENVGGTPHDVPDRQGCNECHSKVADVLLGVDRISPEGTRSAPVMLTAVVIPQRAHGRRSLTHGRRRQREQEHGWHG